MSTPLTIEVIESRLAELQPVIDGVTLDLANAGVPDLDDVDPTDGSWDDQEALRHYILAWNRAQGFKADIEACGVALDQDWIPPTFDTT